MKFVQQWTLHPPPTTHPWRRGKAITLQGSMYTCEDCKKCSCGTFICHNSQHIQTSTLFEVFLLHDWFLIFFLSHRCERTYFSLQSTPITTPALQSCHLNNVLSFPHSQVHHSERADLSWLTQQHVQLQVHVLCGDCAHLQGQHRVPAAKGGTAAGQHQPSVSVYPRHPVHQPHRPCHPAEWVAWV